MISIRVILMRTMGVLCACSCAFASSMSRAEDAPGAPDSAAPSYLAQAAATPEADTEDDFLRYPHAVKDPPLGSPPYDLTYHLTKDVWLRSYGFAQIRWTGNHRDNMDGATGDPFTEAVNVPRVRLHLGVGVTKWVDFFLRAGVQSGGSMVMEQAYANINLGSVRLRVGQFFAVLVMEEYDNPHRLQSSDFSQVANTFGGGQIPGAEVRWSINDYVRTYLVATNGLRTGFGEVNGPLNARYAFLGRVETKPTRNRTEWNQFEDRSSWRGNEFAVRIGASAYYQKMTNSFSLPGAGLSQIAADAEIKGDGWNFFTNGVWQHIQENGNKHNAYGIFAQAGIFLTEVIEIAGAFDGVYGDGNPYPTQSGQGGTGNYNSVIGTVNWYMTPHENRAKLQLDTVFVFNPLNESLVTPAPNAGLLATQVGGQQAVRLNLMVAY